MLNKKNGTTVIGICLAVIVLGLIFYSEYYEIKQVTVETILETNHTILNQTLSYPENTPNIVTKIITIPKNAETGFHTHDEILIGSEANAPTISNSGLCGANPSGFSGYF